MKSGNLLDIFQNISPELRDRILQSYITGNGSQIELIVLYGSNPENLRSEIEALNGTFEDLGYGYGIINIKVEAVPEIYKLKEINYIEVPKNLFLTFEPANQASCIPDVRNAYDLSGEGILIGFIDSGIDYTNNAFRDANGDTRIEYIYDLDNNGAIYDKARINEALRNSNPYSIVPQRDTIGHGTHVAGIAAAGGNIPRRYYGVAPRSSIAMVKMTRETTVSNAKSTQLLRGIKFLIDRANELNMPLSINISFSTNDGAHNGNSLLERYIDTIATSQRVTISIAAGNEAGRGHHASGTLDGSQFIQFNIGTEERIVTIDMYKSLLADISMRLISPSGAATQIIDIRNNTYQGNIGNQQYLIYNTGPAPFDIGGEIIIIISSGFTDFINSGIWTLEISVTNDYSGTYEMWLPVAEGLSENTRFLNPNINNTVGIPGTVESVITVGSYSYTSNTISTFSGRGNIELNPVKPDIAAPGENIESIGINDNFETLSGTSMATPMVAGAAALIMEFGIIKGRDPYLYGLRLKYFLVKGASRKRIDIKYPDNSWGFGTLCALDAIRIWISEARS